MVTVLFKFIINSKYASTALTGQMVTVLFEYIINSKYVPTALTDWSIVTVLKTIEKFHRSNPEDITNVVNTVSTSLHSTFNMFTSIVVMCHQLI